MYLAHISTYQVQTCTYYSSLVQFILGGRHEELEEGYQEPVVEWKQPVPEILLHFLLILDKTNKLVVFIQQLIKHSILALPVGTGRCPCKQCRSLKPLCSCASMPSINRLIASSMVASSCLSKIIHPPGKNLCYHPCQCPDLQVVAVHLAPACLHHTAHLKIL
jgi:hypothetical protein